MPSSRALAAVVPLLFLLAPAHAALAQEHGSRSEEVRSGDHPGHSLEARLMAPCCWQQTLDAHDSPEARALRDEIDTRVLRGEPIASIEADMVRRYGERIRAVPSASVLDGVALFSITLLALGAIASWRLLARGAPRATETPPDAPAVSDARLDDELARFDEAL